MRENIFTPTSMQASAALSAKNFCTAMQSTPQASGPAANLSNELNALNASDVTTYVTKEVFTAVNSGGGGVILIDLPQDLILASI